ncbi:hypothetical protein [Raoultibacter phocaeensis]|uniref:hypothetical protein n=1 Tax=Raoultibacter phocaeensis TaxID=2479841 RepID=UPI00111B4DB8|nr:hypothetical protein [Raoultibacter phocaeensis]
MLSMLRSNLYRLIKTRSTWAFLFLYALTVYLGASFVLFVASNTTDSSYIASSSSLSITAAQMYGKALASTVTVPIAASVFLANFFCADFKTKAVKNVLQAKGGRTSYALAAVVTTCIVVVAAMVAAIAVAEIAYRTLGFAITDYDFAGLALLACQVLLVSVAYACIAVFLTFVSGDETFSVMAALLVSSGLIESFLSMVFSNVFSGFPPLRDCLDGYLAAQVAVQLSSGAVSDAGGFVAAGVTCVVAVGLCVFVMRKRELAK